LPHEDGLIDSSSVLKALLRPLSRLDHPLLALVLLSTMSFAQKTLKRKNVKGLALTAGPRAPAPGIDIGAPDKNDRKEDSLEMGLELRLDFRNEDLIVLKELGAGNGGTVAKVQHIATKHIMARKVSVVQQE
jgi:mitogen-activated protein kinase kinase